MNPARRADVRRKTNETEVSLSLNLDGTGDYDISSSVPFLDHMLAHVAKHGLLDLNLKATGDIEVCSHHTVEDVGIALGQAILEALGDKAGIRRYASVAVPMDEALARLALDISGRGLLVFRASFPVAKIGEFDTQLVEEFLRALAANAEITLHVEVPWGVNAHHIAEAIFKGLGQALRVAAARDEGRQGIPSTKGIL